MLLPPDEPRLKSFRVGVILMCFRVGVNFLWGFRVGLTFGGLPTCLGGVMILIGGLMMCGGVVPLGGFGVSVPPGTGIGKYVGVFVP
jgi:hypothetical protein